MFRIKSTIEAAIANSSLEDLGILCATNMQKRPCLDRRWHRDGRTNFIKNMDKHWKLKFIDFNGLKDE